MRCEMRCETTARGALIRGVKNVSSFGLLWAIAVVSKLERYLNKCYRSIS